MTWEKTKNVSLLTAGDGGTGPDRTGPDRTGPDCQLLSAAAVYYLITWAKEVRYVPSAGWQEVMQLPTQRICVSKANITLNIINRCYIGKCSLQGRNFRSGRVSKTAKSHYLLRHLSAMGFHWTDFHEILYLRISRKFSRKSKCHYNLANITGTVPKDRCTFMKISR